MECHCFNLVIEILFVSSEPVSFGGAVSKLNMMFQSRNRDTFRFKVKEALSEISRFVSAAFQSRNRDTFRFKHHFGSTPINGCYQCYRFNLVIEILFVSRELFISSMRALPVILGFNLVIEILFVSRMKNRPLYCQAMPCIHVSIS